MGVLSRSSKNGGQGIPIALTMGSSIAFVIHSVDRLVLANRSSRSTPFYERGVTEIEVN